MAIEETVIIDLELDAGAAEKRSDDITTSLREQSQERKRLNDQIKINNKELALLNTSTEEGRKRIKKLTDQNRNYDKQINQVNKDVKENRNEQRLLNKSLKETDNSINSQRARVARLTAEYNKLDPTLKGNKARFSALQKEIQSTSDQLKDSEGAIGDNRRSVGDYGSALDGVKSSIAGAFAPTAIIAGAAAIGKEVIEQIDLFVKLRGEVNRLTGASGRMQDSIVENVAAIGRTFDKDFNEVLLAANAVSKQLGITAPEALKKIEQGFLAGADVNGDFLNQLAEYPSALKEAGFSADETFQIITRQVKAGVFSDKGIDAIKEAGLRLRELTPATRDALDIIGISSKEVEKGLRTGSLGIQDVIAQVATQLDKLPPQSVEVGTAIADIFGGPGEDVGLQFLTTLKDIDGPMEDLIDETNNLARAQARQLEREKEMAGNQDDKDKSFETSGNVFQEVWIGIKTTFFSTLQEINEGFQKAQALFRDGFSGLAGETAAQIFSKQFDIIVDKAEEASTAQRNASIKVLQTQIAVDKELLASNKELTDVERAGLEAILAERIKGVRDIIALNQGVVDDKKKTEEIITGLTEAELEKRRKAAIKAAENAEKEAARQAKIIVDLSFEVNKAIILNTEDGVGRRLQLERERFEKEKQQLEQQLIVKEELSQQEVVINEQVNKLIEQNEIAHQKKLVAITDNGLKIRFADSFKHNGLLEDIAIAQAKIAEEDEIAKQEAILAIQLQFAQKRLELPKASGAAESLEVQAQIETLRATIQELNEEIVTAQEESGEGTILNRLFGLTKAQQEDLKERAIAAGFDIAESVVDASFGVKQSNLQAETDIELSEVDERINNELNALQEKLDEEIISQTEFDLKVQALELKKADEQTAIRKEQFEESKRLQINEALIKGALGVIQSFANTTLPFPTSLIGPAVIAGLTAVEIGVIKSQKFTGASGLAIGNDGKLHNTGGQDHSHSGTKYYGEDGNVVELQRNELWTVLNRNSSDMLRSLSDINQAGGGISLARHGATIGTHMQDGGFAARAVSSVVDDAFDTGEQLASALEFVEPPIVTVEDIRAGLTRTGRVSERANI